MKKIMLSLIAVLCLSGVSALSFADEIGKLKADMKGEQDKMKADVKAQQDKTKAEVMAQKSKTNAEMKGKAGEMKQKGDLPPIPWTPG
jgi:uncharacterized protein YxeA